MKKLVFLTMIMSLFLVGSTYGQTQTNNSNQGEKLKDKTKKVMKATGKGLEKGYETSKNTVVKGAKVTYGGLKKIFS